MTETQDNGGNGNSGKRIHAMNSLPERPLNLYDDPAKVFIGGPIYKFIIFLATVQSSSILVLLRHRIGKRVMRGWIFQLLFIFLVTAGGGIFNLFLFFGNPGADMPMLLFAIAMATFAFYHYHVARELTETGIPERLQLHTRARGDSYAMPLLQHIPSLRLPMWHFYTRRFRLVQVLPLDEPAVQRVVEPLVLLIIGSILSFQGSKLGFWLMLSALSLVIVETDYQNNAMEALDDQYDARLESRTMRIIQESLSQNAKMPAKMNGIVTSGIARVSESLLHLQQDRLNNARQQ
jgi:hypothetical protein